MAGLRPGFGLGGITHSLLVMEHLGGPVLVSATAAIALDWILAAAGLMAICPVDADADVGVDIVDPGDAAPPGDEADEIGVIDSCLGRGLLLIPIVVVVDVEGDIADAVAIVIKLLQGHNGIPFDESHSSVVVADAVWEDKFFSELDSKWTQGLTNPHRDGLDNEGRDELSRVELR